jgi:hypothetical protein
MVPKVCASRSASPQGAERDLTIEYPYDRATFFPQRPKLTPAIVEAETRAAMAEGWNPESRGQGVCFIATTTIELGQQPAGNAILRGFR